MNDRSVKNCSGDNGFGEVSKPFPLYFLPKLAEADRVYVTQTRRAANAVRSIRLTATTSPNGAPSADWSPLAGKEVILLPHASEDGQDYAEKVASIIAELEPFSTVRLVELDHLPENGSVMDWIVGWLERGKTEKQLRKRLEDLADAADAFRPVAAPKGKKTIASNLLELAEGCELWHTPAGDAYATIHTKKHRENWPVRSKGFKRWLAHEFYLAEKKTPSSQAINDALLAIEGNGIYEGKEHPVHIRVAEYKDDIYLDLCNCDWQAVRITAEDWSIVDDPPVRFIRTAAMLSLPIPTRDGSIGSLRKFLNVGDDDWPLVISWLLAAMRPRGPYPVLALHGEQGSAKSTAARILRELVDPNTAPIRCEPRNARDLMIAANNGWIIALDNLSHVNPWLSDALCRLSTGGGFSTRTLYENTEETILDAMRPIIVTGIEEVATRGDLLDRSLLTSLPAIPDKHRRSERQLWNTFDKQKPFLLGAMLTAVSQALANLPDVSLDELPRMADFATWAKAGETALGLEEGAFLDSYSGNRLNTNEVALESSPVIPHVLGLVSGLQENGNWEGRAKDLLEEIEQEASDGDQRLKSWPKTPRDLVGCLKRLAPNLRQLGVDIQFNLLDKGRKRRRILTIRKEGERRQDHGFGLGRTTKKKRRCKP